MSLLSYAINYRHAWKSGPTWVWERLRECDIRGALRVVWFSLIRGYIGEACQVCARPYVLWEADHELYQRVTDEKPYPGYSYAPGLYCPECFSDKAEQKGIVIKWKPEVFRERA